MKKHNMLIAVLLAAALLCVGVTACGGGGGGGGGGGAAPSSGGTLPTTNNALFKSATWKADDDNGKTGAEKIEWKLTAVFTEDSCSITGTVLVGGSDVASTVGLPVSGAKFGSDGSKIYLGSTDTYLPYTKISDSKVKVTFNASGTSIPVEFTKQ